VNGPTPGTSRASFPSSYVNQEPELTGAAGPGQVHQAGLGEHVPDLAAGPEPGVGGDLPG
jgi:hypothetical protein